MKIFNQSNIRSISFGVQKGIDFARGKKRYGPVSHEFSKVVKSIRRIREEIEQISDFHIRSFLLFSLEYSSRSHSQIFQDAFVVYCLSERRNGFFCEFGATDGKSLSNSYLLERDFAWTGICAEPAIGWSDALILNRPSAIIDNRCVWSRSGEKLTFWQTEVKELSTVDAFAGNDQHSRHRSKGFSYQVSTVSLNDLLREHNAPKSFDYLSMDTEGSEFQILEQFDFSEFRPKVITIEHNYTESRNKIYDLLCSANYKRVLPELSQFDDWYVDKQTESRFSD